VAVMYSALSASRRSALPAHAATCTDRRALSPAALSSSCRRLRAGADAFCDARRSG